MRTGEPAQAERQGFASPFFPPLGAPPFASGAAPFPSEPFAAAWGAPSPFGFLGFSAFSGFSALAFSPSAGATSLPLPFPSWAVGFGRGLRTLRGGRRQFRVPPAASIFWRAWALAAWTTTVSF